MSALRWGFLGGGKITHEFVSAVKTLPKNLHDPIAIACRNLEDAQKFAASHGLRRFYGNYNELFTDPEIDVVYVGTVNSCHFEQAKLAMGNGKHVLCEKPLSITGTEARELARVSRENKVFLMEGYWTRFFPAFKKFLQDIRSGRIGDVYQLTLLIGNVTEHLDRFRLLELGGGVLMNHGVYGVQLATQIFGKPERVTATGTLSPGGVDLENTVVLTYQDGRSASVICHGKVKMPGELYVMGTKGTLKLPWPFWAPTVVESSVDGKSEFPLPEPLSTATGINTTGFVYEAEEVRRCIQAGLLESVEMPVEESVLVYEICDELRRQLGVKYPQDVC